MLGAFRKILVVGLLFLLPGFSGSSAAATKKVAVLPLQIYAAQDLRYLRDAVLDMLVSRLTWEGKVEVLERQLVERVAAAHQGALDEARARALGEALGADYVLFGSLTAFGESISIDVKMLTLGAERPPVSLYVQTQGMQEVISRIDEFAQRVNAKIFGRKPSVVTAAPRPRFSQLNPERLLVPGLAPGQAQQRHSGVNPYFIIPTSRTPAGKFWQSQRLPFVVTSMAVADVNHDGIQEILLLDPKQVHIYQRRAKKLHLLKTYQGDQADHFLWISTADLNHNQIPEIYVSNRRQGKFLSSFVLEWNGRDWVRIAERIRYHLRVVSLPGKGRVLLGQAGHEDEPFFGDIFVLQRKTGTYKAFRKLSLPRGTNLYSFTLADLSADGSKEILALGSSGSLQLRNTEGKKLWESNGHYAASFDYLKITVPRGPAPQVRLEEGERVYLNAPILVANLDHDKRPEIIVNRNIRGLVGHVFLAMNFFGQSQLYSLSWNGVTMVENWRTPAFQGMTAAYEVAALHPGRPELLVALVSSAGTSIWKSARSRLLAYPIAASPKTKVREGS